ncbi:MAG: DUF1415 domain-containing protein [Methylovulum sp.]|nr:DUF1415 domain-containing protein [Methylovulum sp.]
MNNITPTDQHIIDATQAWLKSFIIEYAICPFAKREMEQGTIAFRVNHDSEVADCLLDLMLECDRLDTDPEIATTLLIYTDAFPSFDGYLDFLEFAEALMVDRGYEGVYQLASFHPDYCFEGELPDDPANYTNRSPYPMVHLLRESSIEQAVASYPQPEEIPQRNIELTRRLGLAKMQALLAACHIG